MKEAIPVQSVTYQVTYSSHPVAADEINIQSGGNNKKTVSVSEQNVALNFFDGIIAKKNTPFLESVILEAGIVKKRINFGPYQYYFYAIGSDKPNWIWPDDFLATDITPCNGACNSGAPDLEDLQADQQFGIHQTVGVDAYSHPPAYNPWYKPCAKSGQQLHSPTIDEVTNFLATYGNRPRPRNSWGAGEYLGTIIVVVVIVAVLSYILMRLGGHFDASYGPIR